MENDTLYETVICTWAERQAEALRSLAARTDLPNELDLLNVVEEIEDVGISQLRSVDSFMRLILSHMVLIVMEADSGSLNHWTREVATFRGELVQCWQPGMGRRIDTDQIWRRAVEEATLKLSTYSGNGADAHDIGGRLGLVSLFGIDDICGEAFRFHDLAERFRAHLGQEDSL